MFEAIGLNLDKIQQETDKITGKKKKKTKAAEPKIIKEASKNLDPASAFNFFESMANQSAKKEVNEVQEEEKPFGS